MPWPFTLEKAQTPSWVWSCCGCGSQRPRSSPCSSGPSRLSHRTVFLCCGACWSSRLWQPSTWALLVARPSRAREISRQRGPDPQPLVGPRSTQMVAICKGPAAPVSMLYPLSSQVLSDATKHGILCTIENLARSLAWQTSFMNAAISVQDPCTFHHCMYGSSRRKHTRLVCNHPCFQALMRYCDGGHQHEPWGIHVSGQWSTHLEAECRSS